MSPRPDTFFEVIIASQLAERQRIARRDGDVAFTVTGEGTWTLELHSAAPSRVRRGLPKRDPQAHLEIHAALFADFVRGTLDAASAVRAGRLTLIGHAELFIACTSILGVPLSASTPPGLVPPTSGVALRRLLLNRHGPINKGEKP